MIFKQLFEPKLAQYSYLLGSSETNEALIFDPMRDIDRYLELTSEHGLTIVGVVETHLHADFLSGARELVEAVDTATWYTGQSPVGDGVSAWLPDSGYSYRLMGHGERIALGELSVRAVHTPGHTPEHTSYIIEDGRQTEPAPLGIITGDFVFVGDLGRPDLMDPTGVDTDAQEQAARELYRSLNLFRELPGDLPVLPGHGAGSACGKALSPHPSSTVSRELQWNPSIRAASDESTFIHHILKGQPEPPTYFGRMREWNSNGVPLLNELPQPAELNAAELHTRSLDHQTLFVDARSWPEYQAGHLTNSISAPIDGSFPTITGCYVDPEDEIVLVIPEYRVDEAVRDLVRVGLDKVVGFITPNHLVEYEKSGGMLDNIADIGVLELQELNKDGKVHVLDVRRREEQEELGYVENAQNVAHTILSRHIENIPRDRPVAVYCKAGVRSTYASAYLKKNGFEVLNVYGGFTAWAGTGLPISGNPTMINLI